jgi:subtilisin family serine protease
VKGNAAVVLPRRTVAGVVVALLAALVAAPVAAATRPAAPVPDGFDDAIVTQAGRIAAMKRSLGAAWPRDAAPGRLLVTYDEPGAAAAASVDPATTLLSATVARVDVVPGTERDTAADLARVPGVRAVEPVRVRKLARVPDDPDYPKQWAHALTGVEQAWDVTVGDPSVQVAVIDSGVLGTHPDLAPNIIEQVDASTGTIVARGTGVDNDPCEVGHGTLVAGVAAAVGGNLTDIAGVAWQAGIVDVTAMSPEGNGCQIFDDGVIAGIAYAVQRPGGPVDVINLSLGGTQDACPTALQAAVDDARAAGVVVVAASGNGELDLPGATSVPASCGGVISVGAVGRDGTHAGYSSTNAHVDVAAPGGDSDAGGFEGFVVTTARNGRTDVVEGTSFASPYVAGLVLLLRAANPALTPDEIEALLEQTAVDAGADGRDPEYGWGVIRADEAMAVAADAAGAAPEPDPAFPVSDEPGDLRVPPRDPSVVRIAPGTGRTEAIPQAVAVSEAIFADGAASHVVLARRDDYADALAGSALGFGFAPLLFTSNTGPLAVETQREIERVLPEGSTVYLLGGQGALPLTLDDELRALGYAPVRLAGGTREETAVVIAAEVGRVVARFGFEPLPVALLATRQNWPDAVSGGALAAFFGLPILLTPVDVLHPATEQALRDLAPELLFVLGGRAAVSDPVFTQAAAASGAETVRLAGPERAATAVAVGQEFVTIARSAGQPDPLAVAVNLRRPDGYAHVLSASPLAGRFTAVYVPVEGETGTVLPDVAVPFVDDLRTDGVLAGDRDVIAEEIGVRLEALLDS